jgi:hypothetical protein
MTRRVDVRAALAMTVLALASLGPGAIARGAGKAGGGKAVAAKGAVAKEAAPKANEEATPAESKGAEAKSAPASFEAALAEAQPVADLGEMLQPLFAECRDEDDLGARQCAGIRDAMLEEMGRRTFVAVGDEAAIAFAPFEEMEDKLEFEVHGCIACKKPLALEGKPRYFTSRAPKAIKGGKVVGVDLAYYDLPFSDAKQAETWIKQNRGRLRVQFVFRVGAPWKSAAGEGVSFVPVAHRVFDRCTGDVIASDPPSSEKAEPMRDSTCPVILSDEEKKAQEEAALPEQLSRADINRALTPMRDKARACYREYEEAGTAMARIEIAPAGSIDSAIILPPFGDTPSGHCLRAALRTIRFPRFKGDKMVIQYPFQLK